MEKLNPAIFADFLMQRERAGDGYIMCAVGQNPKKLSEWYYSGQYSGSQLTQARKWRDTCERVWDCQGLADGYTTEKLKFDTNVRARNNYADWCQTKGVGTIPAKYRVPGAAVFVHNGSYISHVGFLVKPVDPKNPKGDWYLVEARGVMYGVKMYKLSARSAYNRWGLMEKYFDYKGVLEKYHGAPSPTPSPTPIVPPKSTLGSRLLRVGSKGDDVRELQEILVDMAYDLGKYGEKKNGVDGEYGSLTERAIKDFQRSHYDLEVDGKYGEATHAALMDALHEEEEDEVPHAPTKTVSVFAAGRWNVRKGAGTKYGVVTVVSQGAEFPYVSTADNGWLQFEVLGGMGWISNKCATVVEK